jgi:benzoyl-CoA reductase subunit B
VRVLAGEPYGASIAFDRAFCERAFAAAAERGWARDLCAYMRAFWGSMYLNEYAFGGPFPRADFAFTSHICCSHSTWYRTVADHEGIPFFSIDVSSGPHHELTGPDDPRIVYIADQMGEAVEWMKKITGRPWDDAAMIAAIQTEMRTTSLWARICELNQAVPAPLDEKTMYSLYVLATLHKSSPEVADFYEELYEEVADRVKRGVAALATERCRLMTDTQPPWAFLKIFRFLEEFGAVSVGSLYTYGLQGTWEWEGETFRPRPTPMERGVAFGDRATALRLYAEWNAAKPQYQHFYDPRLKSRMMLAIARQWKVDGAILHLNRGCEGLSAGILQNRADLAQAGVPVVTYEGNMGDDAEFDEARTRGRIESLMEMLGLTRMGK